MVYNRLHADHHDILCVRYVPTHAAFMQHSLDSIIGEWPEYTGSWRFLHAMLLNASDMYGGPAIRCTNPNMQ